MAPVQLGEAEENERQFPRQPGCQKVSTQHRGKEALFGHKEAYG